MIYIRQVSDIDTYTRVYNSLFPRGLLCNVKGTNYAGIAKDTMISPADMNSNSNETIDKLIRRFYYVEEDGVIKGVANAKYSSIYALDYYSSSYSISKNIHLNFVCAFPKYGMPFIKGLMRHFSRETSVFTFASLNKTLDEKFYTRFFNPVIVDPAHDVGPGIGIGNTYTFKLRNNVTELYYFIIDHLMGHLMGYFTGYTKELIKDNPRIKELFLRNYLDLADNNVNEQNAGEKLGRFLTSYLDTFSKIIDGLPNGLPNGHLDKKTETEKLGTYAAQIINNVLYGNITNTDGGYEFHY